jgi:hypothetical protein
MAEGLGVKSAASGREFILEKGYKDSYGKSRIESAA